MKWIIRTKRLLAGNNTLFRFVDKIIRLFLCVCIFLYESGLKVMKTQKSIKQAKREIKNILICGYYGMGDAIMISPGIRGIKKCFPDAEIIVVAPGKNRPIFENNPYVSSVVVVPKEQFYTSAKKMRRLKVDLFIMFSAVFEYYLYGLLVKSRFRVGYLYNYRRVWISGLKSPKILNKEINPCKRAAKLCEVFGIQETGAMDFIPKKGSLCTTTAISRGSSLVIGVNPNKTRMWLGAGQWSLEKWDTLLHAINKHYSAGFVIFGGPQDIETSEKLYNMVCKDMIVTNMAGKTSINETALLLSELDLFITVEGGLMHLAQALNIPTVSMFTFSDIESFKTGSKNYVVHKKVECGPCIKNTFWPIDNYVVNCKNDYKCSDAIQPGDVFDMCETALKEQRAK